MASLNQRIFLFLAFIYIFACAIDGKKESKGLFKNRHHQKTLEKMKRRYTTAHKQKLHPEFAKHHPSALLMSTKQSTSHRSIDKAGCENGWTGPDCKTAVCWNETVPFYTHDGSFYELGEVIQMAYLDQCFGNATFPLDTSMTHDLYITTLTFDDSPRIQLFDPNMQEVQDCGEDGWEDFFIIQKFCDVLKTNGPGLYTIVFHINAGPQDEDDCLYVVEAPTTLYPDGGYVKSAQEDVVQMWQPFPDVAIYENPMEGIPAYLAFRMSPEKDYGTPQVVSVLNLDTEGNPWQNFTFTTRSGCATPFITVDSFNCSSDSVYELKFQGLDAQGYPWQRLYEVDCLRPASPAPPITTTTLYPVCSPSVPKVDLIIAFDSSSTYTKWNFYDILDAFYDFGFNLQYGSNQSRIIMGSYDQKPYFDNQHFADIGTSGDYVTKLVNLMYSGYMAGGGNDVLSLFNYVNSLQSGKDAFRSNARKMLVYISSMSWTQDPTQVAKQMRQQGIEFFPIVYGSNGNFGQAQLISPKCARSADGIWDFPDVIAYLTSTLCSSTPMC